jgi:hypothetical protein
MRALINTLGLIAVGFLLALCTAPCGAMAETFNLSGRSGTGVLNDAQFTPAGTTIQATSTGAVSATASLSSSRLTNMTVTFTLDEINSDHSTGVVNLGSCATTWTHVSPQTVTCGFGSHATTVGKHLRFRIAFDPGLDSEGFPNDYSFDTYSWTTATTMIFCPTQGSTCTCGGICNGNACGTQGSQALVNTCFCDCTVAGCTGLAIAAPGSFTCTDALNGNDCNLTWSAVPGASTYQVRRPSAGSQIYSGAPNSFLDTGHAVGMASYDVKANGTCPPSPLGGTTLGSKDSSLSTLASCPVQSRGGVVSVQ